MGWYVWPKDKRDKPTDEDVCAICKKKMKAGEKFYIRATKEQIATELFPNGRQCLAPAHALCVWEEEDR